MKKKFLSALLASLMLLSSFTGCNTAPSDETEKVYETEETEAAGETDGAEEDAPIKADALVLVKDGVSDYVIVRGEEAYVSEVTASTELQAYLKQITGVEIPIVTDSAEVSAKEIVVGKTNREAEGAFDRDELGTDGFVIRTEGEKLYLVGGEQRGTLYAVYELLEAYLGCRFYSAEIEKIPSLDTISLDPIAEDKQIPVFFDRKMAYIGDTTGTLSVKWRLPSISWARWVHTYWDLVNPDIYFEEHPEYYALNEAGERVKDQLCLTNPEVLAIAIESTRNILNAAPHADLISISQMDNHVKCLCENCNAINEAEGSYMGTVLKFVNDIAETLEPEFPDVLFETIAYFFTRNIPREMKPRDNVVIRLCSIECCFNHPLDECESGSGQGAMVEQSFAKDIVEWASITDKLFIWDYTVNFYHYGAPYPNFDVLLENARFFADNNVIGLYESGKSATEGYKGEFHELRLYLLAKIMWNPYMTEEEFYGHMDDFLEGVYGPGWTHLRAYIDYITALTEDENGHFATLTEMEHIFDFGTAEQLNNFNTAYPEELTADMIRDWENVDWTVYWNYFTDLPETSEVTELIAKGREYFDAAYEMAETDVQREGIELCSTQLDYMEVVLLIKRLNLGNTIKGYGGNAVSKIIRNYFKANPDGFTVKERNTYINSIETLARQQADEVYLSLAQPLYEQWSEYAPFEVWLNTPLERLLEPFDTER